MLLTEELRIAVVGAGLMGSDHVRRIRDRISGAVVVAIVDPDQTRGASLLEWAPQARWFASFEDAIKGGEVDAIVIASPAQFHAEVLVPAIEAGLPVLCEKPLAPDAKSALQIVEAEQSRARPLVQLGFMRRFDSEYQDLRELVKSERLGGASCDALRAPQPRCPGRIH